jgi:hypothetical protein
MPRKKKTRFVYACESGDYSDYRVDALFSLRKDAARYAKLHHCEVVRRQLDPDLEQYRKGLNCYWVIMEREGRTRLIEIVKHYEVDKSNRYQDKSHPERNRDEWIFYVWAKDKQHAAKIANERRTQLIALNRW